MPTIDIGAGALDRASYWTAAYTELDTTNPANGNGTITYIELWFVTNATGVKVGTFYGSGTSWTSRGYASLGDVAAGSKKTFSGLSIAVQTGDIIGVYYATGQIELGLTGGSGVLWKAGDQFGAGAQTYTATADYIMSAYGLDVPPAVGRSFGFIIG